MQINFVKPLSLITLVVITCIGMALPVIGSLFLMRNGVDVTATLEPGKYIKPAEGLLNTGKYEVYDKSSNSYMPVVNRLPGYPVYIAIMYKLFGKGNNWSIVFSQCVLSGLTVLLIALSANVINPRWLWPAVILSSLCFNLAYRVSTVMPETLFVFFITAGFFCTISIIKKTKYIKRVLFSSIFFTLAFLTRDAAILFAFFTSPFLMLILYKYTGLDKLNSFFLSTIPILSLVFFGILPLMLLNHARLGSYMYGTQSGEHGLFWAYPCLASRWGCGHRNKEALALAWKKYNEKLDVLGPTQRNDIVVDYSIKKNLARELILSIPVITLVSSAIGSTIKLLMHTSLLELDERFSIHMVHLSDIKEKSIVKKCYLYFKNNTVSKLHLMILLSQLIIVILRVLQIIGLVYAFSSKQYRLISSWLLASIFAFVVVSVGVGNYRYRAPIEPMLILLTLFGLEASKLFFSKLGNRKINDYPHVFART